MWLVVTRSFARQGAELILGGLIIAAAVATLTVLRSVSAATESRVHDLAHRLGKNMLVVPAGTDLTQFYGLKYGDAVLPDSLPRQIRSSELGPHIHLQQARLYGNVEVAGVPLVLVGEQASGRDAAVPGAVSGTAVLGAEAARRLGLGVGDALTIAGVALQVTAVTTSPPEGLDVGVFTALATAQQILGRPGAINALRLGGCWCRLDVPALAAKVERLFPGTRAITVAGVMKAQISAVAVVKRYSRLLHTGAAFVIAAIAAALGAAQVRRQRQELGLLLAIGAQPLLVASLSVAAAAAMGAAGALVGHLLGGPLTAFYTARVIGVPLPVAAGGLWPVLGATVAVSMVGACVPALWASRLDPTTVLREE